MTILKKRFASQKDSLIFLNISLLNFQKTTTENGSLDQVSNASDSSWVNVSSPPKYYSLMNQNGLANKSDFNSRSDEKDLPACDPLSNLDTA